MIQLYKSYTKMGGRMNEEVKSFKDMLSDAEGVKEAKTIPVIVGANNINTFCENATIEEAEEIWANLKASLNPETGFGLTANQIGVNKRVGYIRYAGKEYRLLNTRIVETGPMIIIHGEGCLSLPGKTVNTERYQSITVEDEILGRMELTMSKNSLLPIIFQHEVDHMDGKTILDRKRQPIRRDGPKIGRNAPCPCESGKKYKKCCLNAE